MISNALTPLGEYNLLWLINALTLPVSYADEHYYYDARRKEFFYTIKPKRNPDTVVILNASDLPYSLEVESDLAVRLDLDGNISSDIIEIPRFTAIKKIDVQLKFLSEIKQPFNRDELVNEVMDQRDDFKFILDKIFTRHYYNIPIVQYWNQYKLKMVFGYISQFAQSFKMERILSLLV